METASNLKWSFERKWLFGCVLWPVSIRHELESTTLFWKDQKPTLGLHLPPLCPCWSSLWAQQLLWGLAIPLQKRPELSACQEEIEKPGAFWKVQPSALEEFSQLISAKLTCFKVSSERLRSRFAASWRLCSHCSDSIVHFPQFFSTYLYTR